ncbi:MULTISPECIES: hypothetical protein [unclassified Polynucleobacter]|uniref:hypothetical protein n=1 Tax=unclassified Polynucleobacter TaxID=2640945 RepID=UPI0008AB83BD|nr:MULTISPECIES: hypothetical protein [unclassified Polynucleobacter]MBU3591206.1 hypothetical protein [Polynucleobacter sp. 78F-HAINBA]OHC09978.1 MAG: hypothetical protein A2X74_09380 [Polynucleobacter sp. GWA2_45_21]HBK43046.1 hypothetical protein [Polynucleobacter sp.]
MLNIPPQDLTNALPSLKFDDEERRPIRVFLDSADYSILSDEKCCTPQLDELRERLIRWADSGAVEFWYSGTLLSEMAPLENQGIDASVRRSELLVRLCKTQALISFDRILQMELQNLSLRVPETASLVVYSYSGDWFPEMTGVISPASWLEGIRELDVAAKQHGLNRETRRKLKKQFFKNGQPTNAMNEILAKQEIALAEILQQYPMREQDALVLGKYVTGKATRAQAQEAFLASLRDPSWMIRWFYNHSDKLSPFTDWVRGSSDSMLEVIQQTSKNISILKGEVEKLRESGSELNISPLFPAIDTLWWLNQQDELVVALAKRLASQPSNISLQGHTSADVDRLAPGFATCIRVLHSSTWNSIGQSTRQPKKSDWADSLHAMYAPYVDIFRTDSYMAPIVKEKVNKYGTAVVAKIENLAEQIETRLNG